MENILQLKIGLIKEEDGDVFRCIKNSDRWGYIPGNLDSMRSAINSAADYLEEKRERWNTDIAIDSVTIILERGDGTIINEIDGYNIGNTSQIVNEMCIL